MNTDYEDLSEPEKESDRREADKLIYHIMKYKGEKNMWEGIFDISSEVSIDEMPCCPLCDNEIEESDSFVLAKSNGMLSLAHTFCVEEFVDEVEA